VPRLKVVLHKVKHLGKLAGSSGSSTANLKEASSIELLNDIGPNFFACGLRLISDVERVAVKTGWPRAHPERTA
jgi:hypothetical protein